MSRSLILKLFYTSEGRYKNEDQRERESTLQVEGWLCLGSEGGEGEASVTGQENGKLFWGGKTVKEARLN